MHMLEQHMGQDHVSAQDQADENMARLGSGVYLTKYKDEYPTVKMTSANQLTINPGSLLVNGRFCIIETPEILTVDNGSSGMKERDLVCVHWKEVEAEVQAASGDDTQTITKEKVDLVIVKGTPASSGATDPAISQDTIRSGVGEAWVPFARITKDGLTPSVAFIVDKMAPESEFRDSISHYSTTETSTGKTWIDGKAIYRKVIQFGAMTGNKRYTIAHGVSYDTIVSFDAIVRNSTNSYIPLARVGYNGDNQINAALNGYAYITPDNAIIIGGSQTNYTGATVIIEYTKA